jgi:hypothetical protein
VRIFSGAGGVLGEYMAYHPAFGGGVRVAAGDVDGNGTPDVITAAGPGGGPHVRVFSAATPVQIAGPVGSFYAYNPAFTGGVYVAAGDVSGDGRADVITGAGAGGGPHVRVFSGATGAELFGFFAFSPAFGGGVRVGVVDANGDGRADIVTAAGISGGPHVRVFNGVTVNEIYGFFAYEANFGGGVHAAGSLAGGGGGGSGNLTALLAAGTPDDEPASVTDALLAVTLPVRKPRLFDSLFEDVDGLLIESF